MRIPERVRIGGVDYAVIHEERLNNGQNLAYGRIDYDKAEIRLAEHLQSAQGECQTLLHEILHGIANHFGLAINEEEDSIDKLASGLYMVLKDNPEMFEPSSLTA